MPVPGVYEVDPVHSFVLFRVRHLVLGRVDGRFTSFRGQFDVVEDADQPFDRFEVTFDAGSVDTHVETRDADLRSARFFDVERFPTITLRGGAGKPAGGGRWHVAPSLDTSLPPALNDC